MKNFDNLIASLNREAQIQIALVNYIKLKYKNAIVHHLANEGKRSPTEGFVLKLMGMTAGMPDLMIIHQDEVYFKNKTIS
jgi:hypothetical protein